MQSFPPPPPPVEILRETPNSVPSSARCSADSGRRRTDPSTPFRLGSCLRKPPLAGAGTACYGTSVSTAITVTDLVARVYQAQPLIEAREQLVTEILGLFRDAADASSPARFTEKISQLRTQLDALRERIRELLPIEPSPILAAHRIVISANRPARGRCSASRARAALRFSIHLPKPLGDGAQKAAPRQGARQR